MSSGYAGNAADVAQQNAQDHIDNLIYAARQALPQGVSAKVCHDCEEEIPEARRAAVPGCKHCVHCAPKHERRVTIKMLDNVP